jgi:3-dehydroquinate dehydratase
MRTRSKTPKPEKVAEEPKVKAPPRPKVKAPPKVKVSQPIFKKKVDTLSQFLSETEKKQLTILVLSFFRLFNFLFNVPLGGDISKAEPQPQIKNSIFNEEFFKKIWILYPHGLSYVMNYYLNYNNTNEINETLIDSDFERIMEEIIGSYLNSNAVKYILSKIDFDIDVLNFNEYSNTIISIQDAVSSLSNTEKIEVMIKCFTESFKNNKIYSVSDQEIIVYRGIVGYTINDSAIFLKSKSFISTSTDEQVAISHTNISISIDKLIPSERSIKDNFIIEMRIPPGIKFIDYNKLITDDPSNEWQKELIFPPGIQFNEISKVENKLIVSVSMSNSSFGKTNEFKKIINYLLSL